MIPGTIVITVTTSFWNVIGRNPQLFRARGIVPARLAQPNAAKPVRLAKRHNPPSFQMLVSNFLRTLRANRITHDSFEPPCRGAGSSPPSGGFMELITPGGPPFCETACPFSVLPRGQLEANLRRLEWVEWPTGDCFCHTTSMRKTPWRY